MEAAADRDAKGWMIWNARATFTEAALGEPRDGEDAGIVTEPQPAESTSSAEPSPSEGAPTQSPSAEPSGS